MDRRLAAILVADVVGYSHLVEVDEVGTLNALRSRQTEILQPLVAKHKGRIVKLMGDGALLEFASAVSAVQCAVDLQAAMALANEGSAQGKQIVFRIGINLGEVVVEGGDIYGDGVNVAARLEALCEPGGVWVSDNVHKQVRGKTDISFEDLGEHRLKNIAEPVRAYRVLTSPSGNQQLPPPSAAQLKPFIAVLPFTNLSGDPGQQYLSDGITEDIITELSRFRNLSVAARHASFHLGGKGASIVQVVGNLGVNYVVEGSVQKRGERIRITVQLIDAKTGNHIWAERYDRQSSDIFAVQDEVVSAIVVTLEGRMVADAAALARKKPTGSWSAYDCLLQGRELCNYYREREAIAYFARAIEIDPGFAQAQAWRALAGVITFLFEADPEILNEAAQAAEKALVLDGNDATVHWANAMVMLWLRQYDRAGLHFDRAIVLNPADAQIRADRSNWLRYTGRPNEALVAMDEALKQSVYPPQWFWSLRGENLFDLKRYDEAITTLNSVAQLSHIALIYMAAAYAYLGETTTASQVLARARKLRASVSCRELRVVEPYIQSDALEHLLEGLRNAGMGE